MDDRTGRSWSSHEGFCDYKLRRGASTERHAIRLLERVGFPSRIVEEAMRLVERSTQPGGGPAR